MMTGGSRDDDGDDDDQCLQNINGRLFTSCSQAGPERRRRRAVKVSGSERGRTEQTGVSKAGWLQEMQFEKKNEQLSRFYKTANKELVFGTFSFIYPK